MKVAKVSNQGELFSSVHDYTLKITVFLCGAVGMMLELVGSRLLAPYFGNGLFVWTTLIGIMLGFMSIGNYLGGRLADRNLSLSVLFWILMTASVGIALVSISETVLLSSLSQFGTAKLAAIISAVLLFALPCTVLGMVTPYCTRVVMHSLEDSGRTVGVLFALGTLGSIAGTFLAGFYLIAVVGSHDLIGWLAAVPLALGVFFANKKKILHGITALAVLGLVVVALVLFGSDSRSIDSSYDRYFVNHEIEKKTGRPVTVLARDYESMESAVYADNGEPYMFDYYRFYDLALQAADKVDTTLLIGGGTFVYPRHQIELYPESISDIVEIDPRLVTLAKSDFFLTEDERMNIYVEDGRTFLNTATKKYDVILVDAFKSANSIPYQLTTQESMKKCYDVLGDRGLLVMNVIASTDGPGAKFVAAEINTLRTIFPQVEVYAVYDKANTKITQNISIIASKNRTNSLKDVLEGLDPLLSKQYIRGDEFDNKVPILTDDFAPVDQYLLDI